MIPTPLCGSGSPGLSTPQFRRLAVLHGLLALADSGSAGNGIAAEVSSVVAVGGGLNDGRVNLAVGAGPREGGGLDG